MDAIEKQQQPLVNESDLEELGFKAAADSLKQKRELARKLRIAFEFYRVVTPEHITAFNEKLYKSSRADAKIGYTYQKLAFVPIGQYGEVPPAAALEALREAKKRNCFDRFEVAKIESVTVIPDPILFGCIDGCDNKYFIAQWDDDVKIEDILKEDEG